MTPQIVSPTNYFPTHTNGIRSGGEFKSYQETDPFVGHFSREQTSVPFDVEEVKPELELENSVALISTRTV